MAANWAARIVVDVLVVEVVRRWLVLRRRLRREPRGVAAGLAAGMKTPVPPSSGAMVGVPTHEPGDDGPDTLSSCKEHGSVDVGLLNSKSVVSERGVFATMRWLLTSNAWSCDMGL